MNYAYYLPVENLNNSARKVLLSPELDNNYDVLALHKVTLVFFCHRLFLFLRNLH